MFRSDQAKGVVIRQNVAFLGSGSRCHEQRSGFGMADDNPAGVRFAMCVVSPLQGSKK